jgi:hypothetical protein
MEAGGWKLEAGRKVEAEVEQKGWRLEAGRLEAGSSRLEVNR